MKNLTKILILFVCVMMIAGCAKVAQTEEKSDNLDGGKPTASYDVKLSIDGVPYLNNEVTFTAEVIPRRSFGNVSFEFHLPDGFVLVSGNPSWGGPIKKNQPLTMRISAKAIKLGEHLVLAKATRYAPWGFDSDIDHLFIYVGEDSANVSKEPPKQKLPPMDERVGKTKATGYDFSINGEPLLNEEVQLSLKLHQYVSDINASANISLPEGFMLTFGTLKWEGELRAGQEIDYNITVKAIQIGDWLIQAYLGDLNVKSLLVKVRESSAEVIEKYGPQK